MPKVLYIGFGISPFTQGGAVSYQESLAEGLNNKGWETTCFFAAPRSTISNKPFLKTWYKNKIKFIELYNSPYQPGYQSNPEQQCFYQVIDKLTHRVLDEETPDIVHFHELQMHPASIIDIISQSGIPSIKTMHNYYDICPQRDLMYQGKEVCLDFDNGKRCAECLPIQPLTTPSIKQRIIGVLNSWRMTRSLLGLYGKIKKIIRIQSHQKQNTSNYEVLTFCPRQAKAFSPRQYYSRRQFFVEQLNKLDVIHFSAHRSAEILNSYGVIKEKLKIISLSTKNIEMITPKSSRKNGYPIVFGYSGGNWWHKGYQLLIDAFSMLDQEKAKLIIWQVDETDKLSDNLNIELRGRYEPTQINQVLQEIDVGLVPSIWEEMFGLIGVEFLTARIPVIGSKIGGIPDWLKDGENGFLVPPGDVQALAQKMELFIEKPSLIPNMQRNIKPWKTLKEHTDEMIRLYTDIIARRKR